MRPYSTEAPQASLLKRFTRGILLILVIALILLHAVGGWMVASWIGAEVLMAPHSPSVDDGAVIGIENDRLIIRPADQADEDVAAIGVIGFVTESSYLRLGEVIGVLDGDVTRTFEVMEGTSPELGVFGDVDATARPLSEVTGDLGIHQATYPGPLGSMDMWAIDGSETWVIHVHDHTKTPDQALRLMAALAPEGVSQISIAYRNDPGEPEDPGGRFTFGVNERDDLAAAVAYAREEGASRVILAGYGSGATAVMAEMYRDLGIDGALLDSPILDAESSVRYQAGQRQDGFIGALPSSVSAVGSILASMRFGVSWDTSDYLSRADQLVAPVLIIHGDADTDHPIEDSRTLAELRPDLVRLTVVEGAGADMAWNVDPSGYERAVLEFLAEVRSR